MADKTHHERTLSRSDAGAYVRSLGSNLSDETQSWVVPVGNKDVEVRPDSSIDLETTVDERSRLLGDDLTEVTIKLKWKESGESDTGGESEV